MPELDVSLKLRPFSSSLSLALVCKGGGEEKSGFQAVYDNDKFKTAMQRTNQYACGGNLAWLKPCCSTSPGVPFNENSVQKLKNYYFKEDTAPQRFPGLVIIAVSNSQAESGMMGERGAMEQVSPPELVHSFIMRVAELVDQGAPHDVLSGWLRVFLTCMMVFEKLPTADAKSARSDSLRENAVADYNGFAWTVLQKVYHLGYYRETPHTMDHSRFAAQSGPTAYLSSPRSICHACGLPIDCMPS